MDEMIHTLNNFISLQVQAGYDDRPQIIEQAYYDLCMHTEDEALYQEIIRITDESLEKHHDLQKTWDYVTDCDLLDEAFAELDRGGIIARQNFACCQTCGHDEIGYAIDDTMAHRLVRGYVFFHQQDTLRAVQQNGLYLAYGAVDGKEDNSVDIGYEVAKTLFRAGLSVKWDGTIERRISLPDFRWQRRRVPALFTG